jgi:hypothetical protein
MHERRSGGHRVDGPGRQVVDDHDGVAAFEQHLRADAADIAGSARDEEFHIGLPER